MPFVADLRTVLRGRDFRRLFAIRLVSQGGDGAFQVALASLVFFSPERAATATAAAGAFAVTVLPYTLVGPFAGVLLDRWSRRQVMLVANLLRAVLVLGIAALVGRGQVGVPLYAAVLTCLAVNRFFLTSLGAGLPHVVPRHELVMANAVSPTSGTLAALAGGGVTYLLRTQLPAGDGDAWVLLAAVLAYTTAGLLALRLGRHRLGPRHGDSTALSCRAVLDGARHVRRRRAAWNALAVIGVHRVAYGVTTIATILLCRNHFTDPLDVDAGLTLLAQVVAVTGLGFAAAALVTPAATDRWGTGGWIWRCLAGAAAAQAVLVLTLSLPVLLGAGFVLGLAAQATKICVDAVVQREIVDEYRGRVFAYYDVVFNVAFVLAAGCAALTVPSDGFSPTLYGVIGALYLAAALGYRRSTVRPTAPRRPH